MRNQSRNLWPLLLFLILIELALGGGGLASRFGSLRLAICYFSALLIALVVHEFAHAWTADYLGDPNPRLAGRVSLNPLKHLDPLGTFLIIFTGYGWGKPVEFDPYNLKNPVQDGAWIAAAGPLSNIALATLAAGLMRLLPYLPWSMAMAGPLALWLMVFFQVNLGLAVFNLVPIYPLDGHHILRVFLAKRTRRHYDLFNRQFGFVLAMILILPLFGGSSFVARLTDPAINWLENLLLPA